MAQPLSEIHPQKDDSGLSGRIFEAQATSDVVHQADRHGFLPFATNTFDRCFISVLCYVAISLLWMRFVEPYLFPNNIWIAVILSIGLAVFIVRKG